MESDGESEAEASTVTGTVSRTTSTLHSRHERDYDPTYSPLQRATHARNAGRVRVMKLEDTGDEEYGTGMGVGLGLAPSESFNHHSHHVRAQSAPRLSLTQMNASQPTPTSNGVEKGAEAVPPPPDKVGWLYKRGNYNQSWKKRWFVLRYQTLKYFKSPSDSKPKGFISLSAAVLTPGTSEKMRRLHGFEISSQKYTRVFVIHAENESEMNAWMHCLQANIDYVRQVIEREKTLKQAAGANKGLNVNTDAKGGQQVHPFSATHATQHKILPPEQRLRLDIGEEGLKQFGVPLRLSQWRRDVSKLAFEESSSKNVTVSSIRSSMKLPSVASMSVHNSNNYVAVGMGSASKSERESGSIQLLQIETRGQIGNITELGRFGDLEAGANERIDFDENAASNGAVNVRCDGAISSLHWFDDKLAAGSSGGVVALYKIPNDLTNAAASISSLQPVQLLHHSKVASVPLATPGKWTLTSRISQLRLNPIDKKLLLTTANQHLFLWDVERAVATAATEVASRPMVSEVGSTSPLLAATWNPHNSAELMLGGEEGALRLIDSRILLSSGSSGMALGSTNIDRGKSVSWVSKHAHTDIIRDVAWSPLVPHWVASAGDDGLVKVWDLRFGAEPMRVLMGHSSSVLKVGWSRSHAEMLVSSGVDKTVRLWNIRVAPHYAMYTHAASSEDFTAPIIHAVFSDVQPMQCIMASMSGEVATMQMSKEMFTSYVNHRPLTAMSTSTSISNVNAGKDGTSIAGESKENEEKSATAEESSNIALSTRSSEQELLEREVETLLYLRDFDRAYKTVAVLAHHYWTQGATAFAESLLKLTSSSLFNAAAAEASNVPASSLTIKTFNQLVSDLSRFIPPTTLRLSRVDALTHQRLQNLKTRLGVHKLMKAGKWRDILSLADEICAQLERGSGAAAMAAASSAVPGLAGSSTSALDSALSGIDGFDAATLEKMVTSILPHDHVRALEFAIKIGTVLRDSGQNFALFVGVARLLLCPTVYDRMGEGSNAAQQHSFINMLAAFAQNHVTQEAPAATASAHPSQIDGAHSDSESESESSTMSRSRSASTTLSRQKPTDASTRATGAFRPSLSVASPPSVQPSPLVIKHTRSTVSDQQHAQITLERELRNPKIVLPQLSLLHHALSIVAADEDGSLSENRNLLSSPSSASSPNSPPAPLRSPPPHPAESSTLHFNPWLGQQPPSLPISIDTLGLPTLSPLGAKELAKLFDEQKDTLKLLPALLHLLQLHALLSAKRYDLLFITGSRLISTNFLKSFDFAAFVEGILNQVATPKLAKFLERLLNKDATNAAAGGTSGGRTPEAQPPPGANLSRLQAAALTILNILYNCDTLPSALSAILPRFFHSFTDEIDHTLNDMLTNPSYTPATSYSTPVQDVKAKAEFILGQLQRIRSHSKGAGEPHMAGDVNRFQQMLSQHQKL